MLQWIKRSLIKVLCVVLIFVLLGIGVTTTATVTVLSIVGEEEENRNSGELVGETVEEQIWFYLLGRGFSKECTAGIMGNMMLESGLDPAIISSSGKFAGLCQWSDQKLKTGRWANLNILAKSRGKDWTDLQSQLEFVIVELEGGEATCHQLLIAECGSYKNFQQISNVEDAARVFEKVYERSGGQGMAKRIQYAEEFYEKYHDMATPTISGGTGTVAPGVAGTIDRNARMKWLFPNGTPTSAAQMQQYLVTITVPVVDHKGNSSTHSLRVHKKLANEYIEIFKEMKAIGFPVRKSDTAAYVWRYMATNGSKISYHSYGSVVDLNWNSNPLCYSGTGAYKPGVDPYSVTPTVVAIWKKHGFYWGGDWNSYQDYMHFTYTNN